MAIELGAVLADQLAFTDSNGDFAMGFTSPPVAAITGLVWYYQALTLDANQQIVTTNATATLFTQGPQVCRRPRDDTARSAIAGAHRSGNDLKRCPRTGWRPNRSQLRPSIR